MPVYRHWYERGVRKKEIRGAGNIIAISMHGGQCSLHRMLVPPMSKIRVELFTQAFDWRVIAVARIAAISLSPRS